jgi:DNA repair protein RadC
VSAARIRRVVSRFADVVAERTIEYGAPAHSAGAVADLLRGLIADEAVEVFGVLLLNGKHRVIGWAEVSRGTLTSSLVHPREVFGPAVRMGAAAVVVAHNHPSGEPEPSTEDLEVTRRLRDAGRLLGIPLLDHVVVTHDDHVSLRDRVDLSGERGAS